MSNSFDPDQARHSVVPDLGQSVCKDHQQTTKFTASETELRTKVINYYDGDDPVILFGHFYRLIQESFPNQKWPLFSQFHVF